MVLIGKRQEVHLSHVQNAVLYRYTNNPSQIQYWQWYAASMGHSCYLQPNPSDVASQIQLVITFNLNTLKKLERQKRSIETVKSNYK